MVGREGSESGEESVDRNVGPIFSVSEIVVVTTTSEVVCEVVTVCDNDNDKDNDNDNDNDDDDDGTDDDWTDEDG